MGHCSLDHVDWRGLQPQHLACDKSLLQHLVAAQLLDQLQHHRWPQLVDQSCYHCAGIDLWHSAMVAVSHRAGNQHDIDLGITKENVAHHGGFQHTVDLAFMHGTCTAFGINTSMSEQYLLPMARNMITGQRVKTQDLTGTQFAPHQRALAQDVADQCAAKMSARTGDAWQGFVQLYTPRQRR